MSLTSKLLFGFALISAIGFWLMMDQVLERVERQYLEAAEEPMVDIAHVLAEMLSRDMRADGTLDSTPMKAAMEGAKNRQFEARIYSFLKTRVDMDVYVTDAKGWCCLTPCTRRRWGRSGPSGMWCSRSTAFTGPVPPGRMRMTSTPR
ncbi:hypothetical protein [Verrucomicrobium spinosum]|uniref:hypothetical protein n=1 Tax=Verrucomicrobium spinosum TaxID=2736 RepID=UPI000AB4E6F8|nr:hypothetical protein [Verrucomicrobium spinosum]